MTHSQAKDNYKKTGQKMICLSIEYGIWAATDGKGNVLPNNVSKLINDHELLINTLENIIKSCCHPAIAARSVMVNLDPIRETLKKVMGENKRLGIT